MVYARAKPTQNECWRRTLLWRSPETPMSTREGTQGRRVTSRFICSTNELPRFEKPPPALKLPLLRSISLPYVLEQIALHPLGAWRELGVRPEEGAMR